MDVNFLLGSGISVPTKIPGVNEITQKLLSAKWALQDNRYVEIVGEENESSERITSIQKLLKSIQERYSNERKQLNYEELFYVVDSFKNYHMWPDEYFLYKSEYTYFKDFFNTRLMPDNWYDFDMMLNDIFKYFQSSISYLISNHDKIKGLELFEKVWGDKEVNTCNLFTLNHDVIIENYFDSKSIGYNSGFSERDGDVFLFDYSGLKEEQNRFRIVKLHGSINWFSFPQEAGRYKQARYGISKGEIRNLKNREGKKYAPLFDHPHFLSGTINKILDYSNFTFFELRNFFFSKLETTTDLIVSGYGWRDEGINKIIYNWLNERKHNKIHLLYENLKTETGFRDFDFYNSRSQLIDYGVYLQNCEWDTIKKNIQ